MTVSGAGVLPTLIVDGLGIAAAPWCIIGVIVILGTTRPLANAAAFLSGAVVSVVAASSVRRGSKLHRTRPFSGLGVVPSPENASLLSSEVDAKLGFRVMDELAADVQGDLVERPGEGERAFVVGGDG